MINNRGVTLVNMLIIIIVIVIISGVSIVGGLDILRNSKESKRQENLAAVESVVNRLSLKQGTEGVFTPDTSKKYGKSAVGVLSGDSSILSNWYILDKEDLEDLGLEYIDESYVVNYVENKVVSMSDYQKNGLPGVNVE